MQDDPSERPSDELLAIQSLHLLRTVPFAEALVMLDVGIVMQCSDGTRVQVAPDTVPSIHWFRDEPDAVYAHCRTIEGTVWARKTIPVDLI